MGVLACIAILVRIALGKFTAVPTTHRQNLIEAVIQMFDNFVKSTMGEQNRRYGNWFFGVMVFILGSNLMGLFNLRPPTADVSTTLALAITSFLIIQISGIVKQPKAYVSNYFKPFAIFLPMNLISEIVVPVSLTFRLFSNILAGMIVVGLIYYLLPIFLTIGIPAFLHIYFDVFAGAMQAFIFTMLSMTFTKNKVVLD